MHFYFSKTYATKNEQLTANSDEDGNYVYLSLSSYYTQKVGDLYLSLKGVQSFKAVFL